MQALSTDFIDAVKHNCDVSDAQHAGHYSLCVYLMHMREYFRWEQGLALDVRLDAKQVGEWVAERELYWDTLEEADYQSLPTPMGSVDPFDVESLNDWLDPLGYGYSAGIGRFGKPVFALGERVEVESAGDYRLICTEREWVRELIAPPAMTRGQTIWIRREALRRVLWEMIEEWRWKKLANALARSLSCFGFHGHPQDAVERMTEQFSELAILHELGEKVCGDYLGEDWERMLLDTEDRAFESLLRAVRDHLADCLMVLPALLKEGNLGAVHFYFATMTGLRRQLFPALSQAYRQWVEHDEWTALRKTVRDGGEYWRRCAMDLVETYRSQRQLSARGPCPITVDSLAF
ncbi:MAG: hypothetical protein VW546_00195 [Gammaproteobacteria bacterium]